MSKCGTPCNTCETVKKGVKKNYLFPVPSHLRLEPKRSVHLGKRETFCGKPNQLKPTLQSCLQLSRGMQLNNMSTLLTQIQKPLALRATTRGTIKSFFFVSSQVPDPSPDSKHDQRKYASNRQAHQSTPLLENCVALIRHVIQQLLHLRVSQHSKPIRTSPPTFNNRLSQTTFAQWSPMFS